MLILSAGFPPSGDGGRCVSHTVRGGIAVLTAQLRGAESPGFLPPERGEAARFLLSPCGHVRRRPVWGNVGVRKRGAECPGALRGRQPGRLSRTQPMAKGLGAAAAGSYLGVLPLSPSSLMMF